jgi:hypothetical protein
LGSDLRLELRVVGFGMVRLMLAVPVKETCVDREAVRTSGLEPTLVGGLPAATKPHSRYAVGRVMSSRMTRPWSVAKLSADDHDR